MPSLLLRLPISVKCGLTAALLCAVTGATLLLSSVTASKQILLSVSSEVGQQWAQQLAAQSQQALLRGDQISLQAIVQDYAASALISHIHINDAQGESLAEAGEKQEDMSLFTAEIAADIGSLGEASLALDQSYLKREITELGSTLLLLSAILCALAYSLVAVPMHRLEDYLRQAKARLSQPLREGHSPYPGKDSLGKLLEAVYQPQIRRLPELETKSRDYILLHCHWQQLDKLKKQMTPHSLEQLMKTTIARAETLARLYCGELFFLNSRGLCMRFLPQPEADAPLFRALCCAQLFSQLDSLLKARPGISRIVIDGDLWRSQLAEAQTVEALHRHTASGSGTWLDSSCLEHEALDNWVDREEHSASNMSPPYDELLARQLQQLKQLHPEPA